MTRNTLLLSFLSIFCFFSIANAQNQMRPVEELVKDTSGWSVVRFAKSIARNTFEILPANSIKAREALYQTQVTARSPMGAIIYLTGGILIDNGWIRILGSGHDKLNRTLPEWNKGKTFKEYGERPQFLLVADDVVGGFFAINGGAFGTDLGQIYYLAPDDLKWEPLHMTYTEFINFCFVGDMNQFYSGLRWDNFAKDLRQTSGSTGFYIYPYLWTKEGKDIQKDERKIVPIEELYSLESGLITRIK